MKRFSWLLIFACFFLASGSASAQTMTPNDLIGKWNNQLEPKSTLNIESIDPKTGQIKGTYISPSGTGGETNTLIGWVNFKPPVQGQDNVLVLSFSVRWIYGSITTWAGYLRKGADGVPTITGQWLLVRPIDEFSWGHIRTGQDIYTPVKKESGRRSVPRRTRSLRTSGTGRV